MHAKKIILVTNIIPRGADTRCGVRPVRTLFHRVTTYARKTKQSKSKTKTLQYSVFIKLILSFGTVII